MNIIRVETDQKRTRYKGEYAHLDFFAKLESKRARTDAVTYRATKIYERVNERLNNSHVIKLADPKSSEQ